MLPNYFTCQKHINAYLIKISAVKKSSTVSFEQFWQYKTEIEKNGQTILDEENIRKTAALLRSFLVGCKMGVTGLAAEEKLTHILSSIRPHYSSVRDITLGEGKIQQHRSHFESLYEGLNGITNTAGNNNHQSSIAGKSMAMMALLGQVPGFDALTRRRFEKWTHQPEPEKLPLLNPEEVRYQPDQFAAVIEELDNWVKDWSRKNSGKVFASSFTDSQPGIPPGRLIYVIYHWKYPDPWVDYRDCRFESKAS